MKTDISFIPIPFIGIAFLNASHVAHHMARDITAAPPILPPRLNPDPLLKDIQFDKRHIGPPLPLPRK